MTKRIAACCICKNEGKIIYKSMANVSQFADIIVVVDTGSTDNTFDEIMRFGEESNTPGTMDGWQVIPMFKPMLPINCPNKTIIYTQFLDASEQDENGDWKLWDFAKARNRYVEIADSAADYIWSFDIDDTVENPEAVRACLPDTPPEVPQIWASKITDGITWTTHRLFQTKHGAKYSYPVHEYLSFPGFVNINSDIRISHAHHIAVTKEDGTPRNMRILERAYNNGDRTPRNMFYYAQTLKDAERYVEAAKMFTEYLAVSVFHDEMMFAHLYKTRCYRMVGLTHDALKSAFTGLAQDHRFSELWVELAYAFNQLGKKNLGRACALAALQPAPDTQLFQEPWCYDTEATRILKYTV